MEKGSEKWIGLIAILLLLGLNIFFIVRNVSIAKQEPEFTRKILTSKLTLSGEITTNPDFIYTSNGWLIEGWDPPLKRSEIDWESDGWYENEIIDNRSNIIVIHPLDLEKGKFIQRLVYLPKGSYELVVGIADIAGKISYAGQTDCDDVGFLIKIIDRTGKEWIVSDEIINSDDGWVDLSFDIKHFAKKSMIIRVESYAGGPCGDWRGEWAAVDYIDIIKK